MPISARTTANKIARAADARVSHENTTRFQLSSKAIGELSGRRTVDRVFILELTSELMARGWAMFQVADSSYGFIQLSVAQSFRRLGVAALLAFESKAQSVTTPAIEPEGDEEGEEGEEGVEDDEDE